MHLADLLDSEVLISLEPDELGLRIIRVIASQQSHRPTPVQLSTFIESTVSAYSSQRNEVREAILEAWAWLLGQALLIPAPEHGTREMCKLSRQARRLAKEGHERQEASTRLVPKHVLHPRIRDDVWAFFHRGKYDIAVSQAMKAVEVAVREAAKLSNADIGQDLMRIAFNPEKGPLTDLSTEKGEREARSHLFAGAIGSYKNPHSHRYVDLDDPNEAAEIILLANHLLRIVEARAEAQKQ